MTRRIVPARWPPDDRFDDPRLTGPTPLTVTDDGWLYGHLALWGQPHRENLRPPPRSASGYALFRAGRVLASSGRLVPVGTVTAGTVHPPREWRLSLPEVAAHYSRTGTAVADVAAGEDEHGIWIAGAVRPQATHRQVAALRAGAWSGDWRRWGAGRLELAAVLACPAGTECYPIART